AINARLNKPTGIAFDAAGNLYFSDSNNNRVRRIEAGTGYISIYAGGGALNSDGIDATAATLSRPDSLAFAANGDLYIAERNGHRVRKVAAVNGVITTVAGNGSSCCTGLVEGGSATAGNL